MMTKQVADAANLGRQPSFWYGLPVGFTSLDLHPPTEQLMEVVRRLRGLPDQERDEADRALRLYVGILNLLDANRVQECALGVHPGESGGFTTSVFTVSLVPTSGNSAGLVVAGLAGQATGSQDEGMRPLQLPCGIGFLSEQLSAAPQSVRRPEVTVPEHIWQGTIAVAAPNTPELIVLQMVTPDLTHADAYRDILLGIARTLTFTDPARSRVESITPETQARTGAAAAMRNDFG
ncbi:hypothetical protein [Streptomyces sp. JW3]|uniref:hypothetical protein n=1 Tax=Streptomyces sp. JW3 TaxID=3456955 RepID=UPI003FA4D16C